MDTSKCIFCKIINHQESAEIFYEDEEVMVFKDIKPATKHHYLVIPKRHIKGANCLTTDDFPLLKQMIDTGMRVLIENGGNANDVRLGFHWPPFNSISHLHLHIISPVSEMGFLSRQIFKPNSFWFVTSDYMLERIGPSKF